MKRHPATQDQPIPEMVAGRIIHPKHGKKIEEERFHRQPEVERIIRAHGVDVLARRASRPKKVPM